ncbi:CaiB/BaiF CoA transferase family protein [Sphingobium sp.]|uniref:CaiB/BaiF CoA transferase family protein n=1 Tax=Sphingobium sp. TaxID=1912891 RepID=UPI003B3BD901
MSFGALQDIRIIDLTQMLAGPYATMMLADHGADVIKVEPPEGDMTRPLGPFRADNAGDDLGGYFQSINRNKRSICLNLKTPEGRDALLRLVADADAVVENYRVGVMERLGLGYDVLRAVNPRLVYAALRGFGDDRTGASPYRHWPAYDVISQAMGGIMAITGPDAASPMKVGPGVGDIIPGAMFAFGILAAIHNARRTGNGQFVDIAMVDAVLALCERTIYQHSVQGIVPRPEGNHHPFMVPFGIYPAADGHVALASHQQSFFETMCHRLDAQGLLDDPLYATVDLRVANRAALQRDLALITQRYTKAQLTERLGGLLPYGPVMDVGDIVGDPHYAARDMIVPVAQPGDRPPINIAGVPIKMTDTPGGIHRRAPLLGEDTVQELRRIGLSQTEIDHLIANRAAVAAQQI